MRAIGIAVALAALLLAGCSSAADEEPSPDATSSAPSASSTGPLPTDPAASGAWIGNAGAKKALPSKRQVTSILGAQVTDGPDVATYGEADLNLSAQVEPAACTDVYQLVQALTVPADTTAMTSARYTAGDSEVVVAIGDSKASMSGLKAAIDACPTFRVAHRGDSAVGSVGDLVTDFTVRSAKSPDPTELDVKVDSTVRILMSADAACTSVASPPPGCEETRQEQVSQALRRSGPNLVSVWTMGTTEVDDLPSMDSVVPMAAVRRLADAVANGLPDAGGQ